jgi:pyrroloquinoline quinone biosynthesis protein E
MDVVWVVPDHVDGTAKPCMGGWGAVSLTVAPTERCCPARPPPTLPGLDAPNITDRSLEWAWHHSPGPRPDPGLPTAPRSFRSSPQSPTWRTDATHQQAQDP